MSSGSNIEWTDATWNPVVGCTPVSPGCLNCYAARDAWRFQHNPKAKDYAPRQDFGDTGRLLSASEGNGKPIWERIGEAADGSRTLRIAEVKAGRPVFTGDVRCLPDRLTIPLRWKKPRMVFVNSMSDLFHEDVPFEFIDRVFAVMALCPRHTFQVLTKRPERMAEYLATNRLAGTGVIYDIAKRNGEDDTSAWVADCASRWPLPNVWLGASVENQAEANERIPHLLRCPAAVRFLSVEPMLGPVNLKPWLDMADPQDMDREVKAIINAVKHKVCGVQVARIGDAIDWVIVGGESGPNARPCNVAWVRSIVEQCRAAGVPCFVKQLGAVPVDAPIDVKRLSAVSRSRSGTPTDGAVRDDGGRDCEFFDRLPLINRKGGDMAEWPADLRVREFPLPLALSRDGD